MSSSVEADIFPLPLTAFEQALLVDDRPAYPMTVFCRLRFTGFLKPAAFQAALQTIIQRHPLLQAVIRRNWLGQWVWVPHPHASPTIQWQAQSTADTMPQMTYLDPRQEPGLRCWVLERADGHDVVLQAHHCCADGLGLHQVIEDLLVSYASHQSGQMIELPPLDVQRLRRRGAPKLSFGTDLNDTLKQLRGLIGVYEFFGRSPAPLLGQYSTPNQAPTAPASFPAILSHQFDVNETKKIGEAAKAAKVSLNTLLLRDLFLAIAAWRQRQGIGNDDDWLRLAVPINLRGAADKTMPLSNSSSLIFLDRRRADFADETHLLKSIYEQLWLIKRSQLQYTMILSLGLARLVPGLMPLVMRADQCQATTYLSYPGVISTQTPLPRQNGRLVCGNIVLESVDPGAVLRPHTNAGFMAHHYAGQLRLTLQYDSQVMTVEQAEGLLGMVVWRMGGAG